jgi:fatty-acyl-CoA synthase
MNMGPLSEWPADVSVDLIECSVGELLCDAADAVPDRVALSWVDSGPQLQRLTYREVVRAARTWAADLLTDAGPGDRVAVWAPNSGPWVVAELAVALAGMVLVPLNPALTDAEAVYILASSGTAIGLAVADERGRDLTARLRKLQEQLPALRRVRDLDNWRPRDVPAELPAVDPATPFLLQYTSGTTGRPKGALLSHRAAVNAARFSALALGPGTDEVWCSPLPLHHVGASVCLVLAALSIRAGVVVLPRFEPGRLLAVIEQAGVTHLGSVPTMCIDLLAHPRLTDTDLSSLRTVMIGGSAVPPELIERIESVLGVIVANGYGQSESPNISQTLPDDTAQDKAQTIGRPLPQREARVVLAGTDAPAPLGVVGELWTRSPLTMLGYTSGTGSPGAPDDSGLDHIGPDGSGLDHSGLDESGWLRTGDLCSMDDRGMLRFHGRLRDVIIRGGENIYPREIEEVLLGAPGVADAAVIGAPDSRLGERVVAFIRHADGDLVDVNALAAHARGSLAAFKVPAEWHLVQQLPTTASGKVRKFLLRDLVKPS